MELLEYGGWATGVLQENDRPEYARAYHQQVAKETEKEADAGCPLEPRYVSPLERRLKVVIAGAAGGRVRSTGHLLGRGAVLAGLRATQRDDYPVTVMTGHSVCEVILDTVPIGYTGIVRPDVLILVAQEGRAKAAPRLAAMRSEDRAYVGQDLLPVETAAQVIPLDFNTLQRTPPPKRDFRVTSRNRAILALGAVLRREGCYPFGVLGQAVQETQREEIAASNLAALDASERLLNRISP